MSFKQRFPLLASLALLLATSLGAQTITRGHRLYSPRPGGMTHLVDHDGAIVHAWSTGYPVGTAAYLRADGVLVRTMNVGSTSPLAMMPGSGGGVQHLEFDGTVLWEYRHDTGTELTHHDIAPMPNGNVLMIAWETITPAQAIAAGRDPALIGGDSYPDKIIEVQPTGPTTGVVVWQWRVWDHLVQDFDATKANYGVVADNPQLVDVNFPPGLVAGELNHANGIDYDPVGDLVIFSPRTQDEIWIIDHSTTTAEAAGHSGGNHGRGGDLLWRWGNPQAYQRGTSADQKLFGQHYPRFIPPGYPGAGNITVFNNDPPSGQSEVLELELPRDASGRFLLPPGGTYGPAAPVWIYTDPSFYSRLMSSAERLPSGNTLICSSLQGRIFEIEPDGTIVWEHDVSAQIQSATFHASLTQRTLWSSTDVISASAGGTVEFDHVAGSRFDNHSFLMLGSFSGTSPGLQTQGWTIPLNPDGYFRYLYGVPPGPFHTGNRGLLDMSGGSHGTFTIPPGSATSMVGVTFQHAIVAFKLRTLTITDVSNAVSFVIGP